MNTPKSHWLALPVAIVVNIFAIGLVVITCLLLFCGCAVITISDPSTGHTVARAIVPAWPWQDSNQAVNKLGLRSRTNDFTLGVNGFQTQEVTSTNATQFLENVVGAAVGAAVRAAK